MSPHLPVMEPVVRAVADLDSFALIAVACLEWIKFEAQSMVAIAETFARCQDPQHVRLHLDHVPVIDEDNLLVDTRPIFEEAIRMGFASLMVDGSRLGLERLDQIHQATVLPLVLHGGSVIQAVYERTRWVIVEFLQMSGIRAKVTVP